MNHFKVLVNNKSCHGGSYTYPPIGEWTPTISPVSICMRGYHTTNDPLTWWLPYADLYLCSIKEEGSLVQGDKTCSSSIRLDELITRDHPLAKENARIRMFLVASERFKDPNVDITWADLRRADLRRAILRWAILRGADLRGADLYEANLRGANLRGADLRRADLRRANLRWADLRGADLRGADLRGADLYEANLRGEDLRGADLRGGLTSGGLTFKTSSRMRIPQDSNNALQGTDITKLHQPEYFI